MSDASVVFSALASAFADSSLFFHTCGQVTDSNCKGASLRYCAGNLEQLHVCGLGSSATRRYRYKRTGRQTGTKISHRAHADPTAQLQSSLYEAVGMPHPVAWYWA
jgi:hypothetical protein